MNKLRENSTPSIIFFDGHCNLCNGFIDFIVRWDSQEKFKIAPLQGLTAKKSLPSSLIKELSSVVLIEKGMIYIKSTAVLRIISQLSWSLRPVLLLLIIPKFFRDPLYKLIALNRYKLFGKRKTCRLPTLEEKERFLD